MARYKYLRVSSLQQDYAQQNHCIEEYFAKVGIDPASIDSIVVEKISGTVKHTERKLAQLIDKCEDGDVIYVSEMSRLSRSMADLFALVTECCEKGITLTQCKDGSQIENKSIGGKALLFALGLAAEIEVQNIRQRTKMGLEVIRENIKKNGSHVSKAGNVITHFGRSKGCCMEVQNAASTKAKQDAAVEWREKSKGYNWVRRRLREGMSRKEILRLFNDEHEHNPGTPENDYTDGYSTKKGSPLSEAMLSYWYKEMKATLMVPTM